MAQKSNPIWITLIILIFLFYWMPAISFRNDLLPNLENYGAFGRFMHEWVSQHQAAIRNTYLIVMVIHLTEAVLAAMICSYMDFDTKSTLKWTLSVFIHGVFSFWPLMGVLFEYESRHQGPLTPQMKFGLADLGQ